MNNKNWDSSKAEAIRKLTNNAIPAAKAAWEKALNTFNGKYELVRLERRGGRTTVIRLRSMGRSMSNAEVQTRKDEIEAIKGLKDTYEHLKHQLDYVRRTSARQLAKDYQNAPKISQKKAKKLSKAARQIKQYEGQIEDLKGPGAAAGIKKLEERIGLLRNKL